MWDVDTLRKALEAGLFAEEDGKLELDGGLVIVAPMDGGAHMNVGMRLMKLWVPRLADDAALNARMDLFIPGGIHRGLRAARAPDAMLVKPGSVQTGRWETPTDVFLAIEFSDTTLSYDDGAKRADYAKGGVAEVRIVRIREGDVRVCRGPQAEGTWSEEALHAADEVIAPLAAPELAIPVKALFEG